MLDRLREMAASGLQILAQRLAHDQRYPNASRVSTAIGTLAGVAITPDTAITVATVWACIRFLSQNAAVLPWRALRTGDFGAEVAVLHPVNKLIYKRPNPEWSSFQFRETLVHWALRWGNGYAEIERDELGRPFALWPIHPERVRVCRDPETQKLYYEVSNGAWPNVEIDGMDMFHLRGFGEGPVGVNVIHYASQSIGWARAAQLFGAAFFGNGMNVAGVVINKKPLKPDGLKRQKVEFENLYKGPARAGKTAFLDNDADWKAIGISPEQAQLVHTHQFLVEEICRWFGVPPHKVQHLLRATFANIESQAIEVVVDSLAPWVKRLEDEADWKLFGPVNRQNFYTKINMNALMRGDTAARSKWYETMVKIGAYSPNRVLEAEDENEIGPEGDIHVMQNQNVTLETIAKGFADPVTGQQSAPAEPESPDNPPEKNPNVDPAMGNRLRRMEAKYGLSHVA
jgi:HK97 family phage portal protein